MQRKNFKKIGNKLGFNTPTGDPIFIILQELDEGFFYFLETTPFGPVSFVHRHLVEGGEKEEVKEEKVDRKEKKNASE